MKNLGMSAFTVLFKKIKDGENVSYVPVDIITGTYDENKAPYKHIIESSDDYGFAFREEVEKQINSYKRLPFPLIKGLLLNSFKKYFYILTIIEDTNSPAIMIVNKKGDSKEIFLESDVLEYYKNNDPDFLDLVEVMKKQSNGEIDVNYLYREITNSIIDQDDQIKTILSAIWKQRNDFSSVKSRNILIDGETGVGKTATIKKIISLTNLPIVMDSITEFTPNGTVGRSLGEMLLSLIDKVDGDVTSAQDGVIVLDDIDKIAVNNEEDHPYNRLLQEEIIKMASGGKFDMIYHNNEITFDASNLMVILIGNFSRIRPYNTNVIGFENIIKKQEEDKNYFISKGLLPEFINEFSNIVIMNKLDLNSYIKILNEGKECSLNLNKELLKKKGIELVISDDTIKLIANNALNSRFGARSLEDTIERALALATFEIASNPEMFDKLIISDETILDNKKYKLIRKRNM